MSKPCVHCGWDAYRMLHTLLYGYAPVCSVCIANSRVLYRVEANNVKDHSQATS